VQWLAVLGLLLAALGCNKQGGGGAGGVAQGAAVYASSNCATCHGDQREGKPRLGPALTGLSQHWASADELAKYIADPRNYALGDQRLREQMTKFAMKMPAVPMTDEQRLALAQWLLQDPATQP
jgi:mono/diheme cytochrome c family protein